MKYVSPPTIAIPAESSHIPFLSQVNKKIASRVMTGIITTMCDAVLEMLGPFQRTRRIPVHKLQADIFYLHV